MRCGVGCGSFTKGKKGLGDSKMGKGRGLAVVVGEFEEWGMRGGWDEGGLG